MKRGGSLKRTRLNPGTKGFRKYAGQAEFRAAVLERDGDCARMGGDAARLGYECYGPLDAHHLIEKGVLAKHGLAEHAADPANGITLCRWHHDAHHTRAAPLSWDDLPGRAKDFADALGLIHMLERLYPARLDQATTQEDRNANG